MDIGLDNIRFIDDEVDKRTVFNIFADMAKNKGVISSKDNFIDGLFKRENEFSTGIGSGVAIPHCKSDTVNEASVFVQKFKNGLEWGAIDNNKVTLAICLAVPEKESSTTHIKLLSKIARSLINKDIAKKLLNSNSEEELLLQIKNILSK